MWRLRKGVHPVLTDEGGALLDERTGRWTALTPTAAAAVTVLLATPTVDQAAARYADRYGIAPKQAAHDLEQVTDALCAADLILTQPIPERVHRRWWRR